MVYDELRIGKYVPGLTILNANSAIGSGLTYEGTDMRLIVSVIARKMAIKGKNLLRMRPPCKCTTPLARG